MPADGSNSCPVLDIAKWTNRLQRSTSGLRTNHEPPYALIAANMIAVGKEMDERNELIEDATRLIQKAAILIETAVSEADPEDCPDSNEFLTARVKELRELCDFMSPPRPCWPANVVPFVPRRVG